MTLYYVSCLGRTHWVQCAVQQSQDSAQSTDSLLPGTYPFIRRSSTWYKPDLCYCRHADTYQSQGTCDYSAWLRSCVVGLPHLADIRKLLSDSQSCWWTMSSGRGHLCINKPWTTSRMLFPVPSSPVLRPHLHVYHPDRCIIYRAWRHSPAERPAGCLCLSCDYRRQKTSIKNNFKKSLCANWERTSCNRIHI